MKKPKKRLKKKKKRSNAKFYAKAAHYVVAALLLFAWWVFIYVFNDGSTTESQDRIFGLILVILFMGFLFGPDWCKKKYKDYMNNKKNKD